MTQTWQKDMAGKTRQKCKDRNLTSFHKKTVIRFIEFYFYNTISFRVNLLMLHMTMNKSVDHIVNNIEINK